MSKQFYNYYHSGQDDEPHSRRVALGSELPLQRDGRRQVGLEIDNPRRHRRAAKRFKKGHRGASQPGGEQPFDDQPRKQRHWRRRILLTFCGLILIVLLAAGWVGWKFLRETTKVFGGTPFGNLVKLIEPTTLHGQDSGHVNVLIAGNSVGDPGHGGATLTDSIMILSIDTRNHQGYMFSVPRDLWVNIPGEGYAKVNDAYPLGQTDGFQESGLPSGGMGLLEKTIEQYFQVPIDYYALVNYAALKNIVNAIGGIDVNIQSADPRGLYDPNINVGDGGPLQLPNGADHLDGQTALNLARARGDPTGDGRVAYGFPASDFDRTLHQRQILVAIQSKMQTAGVLINPFKLGKVLDGVGTNVTTDMKINQARKLVSLVRGIGTNNMQSLALESDTSSYLQSYTTDSGQSALIPAAGLDNYSDIRGYIQPLIGSLGR